MIVEFGLIKKPSDMVMKGDLYITIEERTEETMVADIWHKIEDKDAHIKLSIHDNKMEWMFLMPVHQSEDWEIIDLDEYFFQFKCELNRVAANEV